MTIDTTATPLGTNPPTDQHPATAPGQGIVHTPRRYRHQALCTCGYTGKRRLWRSIAVLDALEPCQFLRMGTSSPAYRPTAAPAPPPVAARSARRQPPTTPSARAPTTPTGMSDDHTARPNTNRPSPQRNTEPSSTANTAATSPAGRSLTSTAASEDGTSRSLATPRGAIATALCAVSSPTAAAGCGRPAGAGSSSPTLTAICSAST